MLVWRGVTLWSGILKEEIIYLKFLRERAELRLASAF